MGLPYLAGDFIKACKPEARKRVCQQVNVLSPITEVSHITFDYWLEASQWASPYSRGERKAPHCWAQNVPPRGLQQMLDASLRAQLRAELLHLKLHFVSDDNFPAFLMWDHPFCCKMMLTVGVFCYFYFLRWQSKELAGPLFLTWWKYPITLKDLKVGKYWDAAASGMLCWGAGSGLAKLCKAPWQKEDTGLGSTPSSATDSPWETEQVTTPLWTSLSLALSAKWGWFPHLKAEH